MITASNSVRIRNKWYLGSKRGSMFFYIAKPDGTDPVRLTSGQYPSVDPIWSPDGKRIAFTATTNTDIFVVNIDGSGGDTADRCQLD